MSVLLREFETLSYDANLVKESKEKNKPLLVKALLQRADALNQNKRIYPRQILEREIENYTKAVKEGRATGELDHPDSSVVSLENVSHIVREVWWEGDTVFGKVEILNTPKGRIARELMEGGVKLGISSRGVGDVMKNEQGYDVVDESFMLVSFDLVSEPSTHEAWLVREGKQNKEVTVDGVKKMVAKVDRVNRIVNEILKG